MFKFNGFTEKANKSINTAILLAEEMGHNYIGSEHILLGLLKEEGSAASNILEKAGVKYESVENLIKETEGTGTPISGLTPEQFTPRTKRLVQMAVSEAARMNSSYVGTEHLLLALIADSGSYANHFITQAGGSKDSIISSIRELFGSQESEQRTSGTFRQSKDAALDKYGRDLTKEAEKGNIDPVIGRRDEIDRVIQILSRRTKNNPCLIGEPGVGKTAVAEGRALKIVSGDVPEPLKNKRILREWLREQNTEEILRKE